MGLGLAGAAQWSTTSRGSLSHSQAQQLPWIPAASGAIPFPGGAREELWCPEPSHTRLGWEGSSGMLLQGVKGLAVMLELGAAGYQTLGTNRGLWPLLGHQGWRRGLFENTQALLAKSHLPYRSESLSRAETASPWPELLILAFQPPSVGCWAGQGQPDMASGALVAKPSWTEFAGIFAKLASPWDGKRENKRKRAISGHILT